MAVNFEREARELAAVVRKVWGHNADLRTGKLPGAPGNECCDEDIEIYNALMELEAALPRRTFVARPKGV